MDKAHKILIDEIDDYLSFVEDSGYHALVINVSETDNGDMIVSCSSNANPIDMAIVALMHSFHAIYMAQDTDALRKDVQNHTVELIKKYGGIINEYDEILKKYK